MIPNFGPKHLRTFRDSLSSSVNWWRVSKNRMPHGLGQPTEGLDLDPQYEWVVVEAGKKLPRSAMPTPEWGERKHPVEATIGVAPELRRATLRWLPGRGNGEATLDGEVFSVRATGRRTAEFSMGAKVLARLRRYGKNSPKPWETDWQDPGVPAEVQVLAYLLTLRFGLGTKLLRDRTRGRGGGFDPFDALLG